MPRRNLDARSLAHEVLVRVESTAAFADVLLGERLADARLVAADQALATRLVYGTLAWQGRLDHHLATLLREPLSRLPAAVRAALRLGLYQLLFLDRVPTYAAVDESVRLARRAGRAMAGVVNAVLRRAADAGSSLPLPDAKADPLGRLAVEWSHPRWLVERWAAEMGHDELPSLLAANNVRGRVSLRANPLRTTRAALLAELSAAGATATASAWASHAIVVERGAARLRTRPAWREGRFTFQGEAAQLVAQLVPSVPGACVLDACAAPGGKAAQLAALNAAVVALDRRATGVERARAEAIRLGVVVHPVVGDATRPPFAAPFDAVLVDAPCSGLGTLRRHPEVRWRRHDDDVARLADLQAAILSGVTPLVRRGGVLVFAVCTLTRDENEGVIDRFLAAHPGFALESAAGLVPDALVTSRGFLRTLPHRDGLDGFFAARLRALESPGHVR